MTFQVAGALRGRGVSARWLDPPGDPPGIRWTGDPELVSEIGLAVASSRVVSATPTGPSFIADHDPPGTALVTALSVLDETVETFAHGDVPTIPGLDVPADAVS